MKRKPRCRYDQMSEIWVMIIEPAGFNLQDWRRYCAVTFSQPQE